MAWGDLMREDDLLASSFLSSLVGHRPMAHDWFIHGGPDVLGSDEGLALSDSRSR